jgi:hypothetical protein
LHVGLASARPISRRSVNYPPGEGDQPPFRVDTHADSDGDTHWDADCVADRDSYGYDDSHAVAGDTEGHAPASIGALSSRTTPLL